jgi:hypothetical protein
LYIASPYFSFWRLCTALQSGDRDSLEAHIDFPSVRESLKDQLRVQMMKSMAQDKELQDNPFGGLAIAFAPMMVNYAVDNFVTPSGIAALIVVSIIVRAPPTSTRTSPAAKKDIDWSKLHSAFFTSPTRFMVDINNVRLHFRFTGLGWQLKRIEILRRVHQPWQHHGQCQKRGLGRC